MAQVFLSYARDDVGRAKSLAAAIERAGFSVWWDRDLEGGAEYSLEIDEALKAADVVVVLWSKDSVGSAWVRDEAAAGRDSGRLVPVRLDGSEPPLGFRQYQTIDLSRCNGRSDSAGLKTLKRAIAAKVGRKRESGAAANEEPSETAFRRAPTRVLLASLLMLLAAGAAYFWYARKASPGVPTIAIVAAPSGGDPARSQALARSLSVELGTLQSGPANNFELHEDTGEKSVDFLVQVAAARNAASGSADLSIVVQPGKSILWTGHFEKPAADESGLRLQASTRLAAVLSCLAETASGRDRLDQPTLKLYLRGCEKFRDEIGGIVDPAQVARLRAVVARAPRFAPAIAHLALVEADDGRVSSARALVAKAKALDPTLSKIYLAEVGLYERRQWDRRQAILAEGLRQNPNSAGLHEAMGFELSQVGRRAEGLTHARRARELDPLSPIVRANFAQHLFNSGRIAEAQKELAAGKSIWPDSKVLHEAQYAFDLRFGDAERALRSLREDANTGITLGSTVSVRNPGPERFLVTRLDPTPQNVQATVDAYITRFQKDPADAGSMTLSLVALGRVDQVFDAYRHPVAVRSMADHTNTFFRPFMKPMLHDSRFMQLAARLGLLRNWTETGKWPDFCLDQDLPYDCKQEAARLVRAGQAR